MRYNQKEFGQRLRDARRAIGHTQQELADILSVDQKVISRLECGERRCSLELLVEFSEILNVTTDHLLKGTPNRIGQAAELDRIIGQLVEFKQKL